MLTGNTREEKFRNLDVTALCAGSRGHFTPQMVEDAFFCAEFQYVLTEYEPSVARSLDGLTVSQRLDVWEKYWLSEAHKRVFIRNIAEFFSKN